MDFWSELVWEPQSPISAVSSSSENEIINKVSLCPDLDELFSKNDSHQLDVSEDDFDLIADLDFNWLDQKVDLHSFEDVLQGSILDNDSILNVCDKDLTFSSVDLKDPCSPISTHEEINSYPSSPEQFVPGSQNNSTVQPKSSVQLQFVFNENDAIASPSFSNASSLPSPTTPSSGTSEEMFAEIISSASSPEVDIVMEVDPLLESYELETIEVEKVSEALKILNKKGQNGKRKAPKRVHQQVRSLDVSEKKQRKKGQNKTAANRYRQKKRSEGETLSNEEADLEKNNAELHSKVKKISSEIMYLKSLLREAFTAKGLLKSTDN